VRGLPSVVRSSTKRRTAVPCPARGCPAGPPHGGAGAVAAACPAASRHL